jgi:hypothetical protein
MLEILKNNENLERLKNVKILKISMTENFGKTVECECFKFMTVNLVEKIGRESSLACQDKLKEQ